MAIYDPRYEVAWQLSKDDNEEDLVDVRDQDGNAARENFESLARFAGLLAGAEVAAITLCRGEGLIIELTDPPSPWLTAGAFMRAQPSNSTDDSLERRVAPGGQRPVVLVQGARRLLQRRFDRRPVSSGVAALAVGGEPRGTLERGKPRFGRFVPGPGLAGRWWCGQKQSAPGRRRCGR